MTGDELERLRRANPVQPGTADRLAAPHSAAFRETIAGGGRRRAQREPGGTSTQHLRLSLAAAAVALVALPGFLLTRTTGDDVIVRTPATNRPTHADDNVEKLPPIGDDNVVFTPTDDDPVDIAGSSTTDPTGTTTASSTTIDAASASTTTPAAGPVATDPPPSANTTVVTGGVPSTPADTPTSTTPPPATATTAPADTTAPSPTTVAAPSSTTPATTSPTTTPDTTTPDTTTPDSTTPDSTTPDSTGALPFSGPFDPATDLLVVAFDFSHRDDGHASVAARELSTTYGLDPIVVAGTASPESELFTHDYAAMMSAAWGSNWSDAGADRENAISESLQRWLTTIDAGGHVWVAEGGVSDFTAALLREVRAQRPGLNTSGIVHLIHHSSANVDRTQSADLALLGTHADIIRIDDGNNTNDSADLNGSSDDFERIALAGPTASAWTAAFDYMSASSLDFSDTVTVLHALGIGLDVIADANDFANITMT